MKIRKKRLFHSELDVPERMSAYTWAPHLPEDEKLPEWGGNNKKY